MYIKTFCTHSSLRFFVAHSKFLKLPVTYTIQQYYLIFLSTKELTPEATTIDCKIILFIMTYESISFLYAL